VKREPAALDKRRSRATEIRLEPASSIARSAGMVLTTTTLVLWEMYRITITNSSRVITGCGRFAHSIIKERNGGFPRIH
jgi:hypothetical protein